MQHLKWDESDQSMRACMQVKLVNMESRSVTVAATQATPGAPKLLMRPSGADQGRGLNDVKNSNSAQSMKEREDDYRQARERILGVAEPQPQSGGVPGPGGSTAGVNPSGAGRGGYGRSGGGGGGGREQGRMGGGRGRKAVFKDRASDLQDPDYVRGYNR